MEKKQRILIIGAGASGCLLLHMLIKKGLHRDFEITLAERRTSWHKPARWCFWETRPFGLSPLISHRWPDFSVSGPGWDIQGQWEHAPYAHISGDDFYSFMDDLCTTHSNDVRVLFEQEVSDLRGADYDYIFDSRLPADAQPSWFQHFYGQIVKTEGNVFSDKKVGLMHFQQTEGQHVHFIYVLPFTKDTALIETTYLSAAPFSQKTIYQNDLAAYIGKTFKIDAYEVIEEERGAIPLFVSPPRDADSKHIPIGAAAGAVRCATGYGFWHMMTHAENLADALRGGGHLHNISPIRKRTRWMDHVFLRAIQEDPKRAPDYFRDMFTDCKPQTLSAFLMDEGGWAERFQLMRSLPSAPFLKQVIRA